ncbi:hypothetical protein [Mycobacterium deserti]|uniref:Uncharacterized protein n=1 Tax=Mycobacterium deserti TaxID=2978347 RepID=A0ABT2M6G4_9MYCO|nr:hypothetical protein [Mycobacterium deserti]MCT7657521.1 hypothetical protein [Mycobacterium deserti]
MTEIMLLRAAAPSAGRRSRTMLGYLLMPRPKDLVKGLLIPTTYVLGLLSAGDVTGTSLLRAGVVLLAVELLIYPARYQWNDIRGFAADQQHPASNDRGRLPGPLSSARAHVFASCAVIVARLAVTGVLIVSLPGLDLGPILGFATLGVFGVAIVYEMLRSVSTGRSGDIPAPLSTGIVLLWLTAGGGYVVRGITGLALAVELTARPTLAVAAAITLWAYGIAFVTGRWAMEATAFASAVDGRVVWHARAGQAREHLLALVRWLPTRVSGQIDDLKDWAPLRESTSQVAPWHLAAITAGGAAAVTGRLLCGPCTVGDGVAATVVGAVTTAVVTAGARWRPPLILLGAAGVAVSMVLMGSPRPGLAVLPWLLLMGAYLFFSTRTMRRFERPNALGAIAAGIGSAVGRFVVGRATWEAMTGQQGVSVTDAHA